VNPPFAEAGTSPHCWALHQQRENGTWASSVDSLDFLKREDGPTAVEYAVMLALIIVVCIAAISALGSNAQGTFNKVGSTVNTAGS